MVDLNKPSFPAKQLKGGKNVIGYSEIDLFIFRLGKIVEYKIWTNLRKGFSLENKCRSDCSKDAK